jgi:hypothetical protein
MWGLAPATQVPRTRVPIPLVASTIDQAMNQPLEIALHCVCSASRRCCRVASASQPFLAPSKLWNGPCEYLVAVMVA